MKKIKHFPRLNFIRSWWEQHHQSNLCSSCVCHCISISVYCLAHFRFYGRIAGGFFFERFILRYPVEKSGFSNYGSTTGFFLPLWSMRWRCSRLLIKIYSVCNFGDTCWTYSFISFRWMVVCHREFQEKRSFHHWPSIQNLIKAHKLNADSG